MRQNFYVITLARKGAARPFEHRLHLEMDNFDTVKSDYHSFKGNLLEIPYMTLNEYFASLKSYGQQIDQLKSRLKLILERGLKFMTSKLIYNCSRFVIYRDCKIKS